MNIIGYIRVSTQGQAKDGYSLGYQQDEIRSYCQEKGWNLMAYMWTKESVGRR